MTLPEIRRIDFGRGTAFDTGSRVFHAQWLNPPHYNSETMEYEGYDLVEFTNDGRMPRIGYFRILADCERKILAILSRQQFFSGDATHDFPLNLVEDSSGSGLHFFIAAGGRSLLPATDGESGISPNNYRSSDMTATTAGRHPI